MNISRRVIGIVALGAMLGLPVGVLAGHQFTDVPNNHQFHADIGAIAAAGVTQGCSANQYCPEDYVTRGEMAAFMNRLGALAPGKTPVVNATKLDGLDSTAFLPHADVITYQHFPWVPNGGGTADIVHGLGSTVIETINPGYLPVQLALQSPGRIGNRLYGLKSVQVCYGGPVDAMITDTIVSQSTPTGSVVLINNTTDRPLGGNACYTVTDATPTPVNGGTALILALGDDDSGAEMTLRAVAATWTPVIGGVTEE
jgi:hypothetical protein